MKKLKLSLSAALALVALLLMAWVAQATPIGGPVGEARAEVRALQEQFSEFVDSLNELDLELFNNQDQNDTGDKGLIDLIYEAIGVVDNNEDAWTVIQFIDATITLRNRIMTTNFNEIQTLISQITESVGELQGKIEGLIEAGKLRLIRGQKIQRKLDTVSGDLTIIQDTFAVLESKIEDGDEGEEGCETTGRLDNCLDDVGDFLTLAEDTVSADPFSFDSKTVVLILAGAKELVDNIMTEKDRLFGNLREIARALKTIDGELRKTQSDLKKGKSFGSNGELSSIVSQLREASNRGTGLTHVQLYDLQGHRVLDESITPARELSNLLGRHLRANGVYLYVLTQTDESGKEIGRRVGKWVVRN